MRGANLNWTEEQISTLKKMWADGSSGSQIGIALGKSRNAVLGKIDRLDLPPRITKERIVTKKAIRERRERTASMKPVEIKIPDNPPIPANDGKGFSIIEIPSGCCKHYLGRPQDPALFFCGVPVRPGSVMCQYHHNLSYYKITKNGKRVAA